MSVRFELPRRNLDRRITRFTDYSGELKMAAMKITQWINGMLHSHACACGRTRTTTAFQKQLSYMHCLNLVSTRFRSIIGKLVEQIGTATASNTGQSSMVQTTATSDVGRMMSFFLALRS